MELKEIEPAIIGFTGGLGDHEYVLERGEVTSIGYFAKKWKSLHRNTSQRITWK